MVELKNKIGQRMLEFGKILGHKNRSNEFAGVDTWIVERTFGTFFVVNVCDEFVVIEKYVDQTL